MKRNYKMASKRNHNHLVFIMWSLFLLVSALAFYVFIQGNTEQSNTYRFVLILKKVDENNDFWRSLIEGARIGVEELNGQLEVRGPDSEEDIAGQNAIIAQTIAQAPDVILLVPSSVTETTPYIQKAIDAGIVVILVDSVVAEEIGHGLVATDNVQAGISLAEFGMGFMNPDTQIGIVAHVKDTSTTIDRVAGIRYGLQDEAERIVDMVFSDSSPELAYTLTKQMLSRHPEITLLFATNEPSAVGAARALRDLELYGQVSLIGFDNSIEQIQFLEKDIIQGIVIQKPVNMAYLAVKQGYQALQSGNIQVPIDSGSLLIDQSNMYFGANQRLLFPFFEPLPD
ncbi:MAG: substrate-binding domain-containing protein [Lachnospiraceae bacterium]|nr:substrate-binding domain-containing protein [Lachnospiraceae bacterium]